MGGMPAELPPAFRQNVTNIWGEAGSRWLADLPTRAAEVLSDWQLRPSGTYPLSINWVIPVQQADGEPAVLKLGLPTAGHIAQEGTALEYFGGAAAVRLLARDDARGALLLAQARPGTPLSSWVPRQDGPATGVLIDVMHRLHRPAPAETALPDLLTHGDAFTQYLRDHQGDDPLPRLLVERASRLFTELCATATERVVLHGDLHHDNVLADGRDSWVAIDPHGVVGDRGYELGALLYNPPGPADEDDVVTNLLFARIEQLSAGLDLPFERVVAWGFVQAVLSEVWTATDGGPVGRRPLRVAHALLPELPG
jgi:streptomycin 6-kinase